MDSLNLKNETILVTGADGFIGSHLVESLVVGGYKVRAFCLYNSNGSWGWLDTFPQEIKDNLEVFLGDIRDSSCVREAMQGCTVVFHLAALIAIPYSYVAASSYVDTNIHGTLNVVQIAKELDIKRVIHTSTSETYGSAQFVPITENHPLVGQSPYAASKIGADQIALSYWRSFNTPVVKDTCNAFIEVALSDQTIGKTLNVASNFEISIGDTVNLIADLMNVEVEVVLDNKRIRPENSEVNRLFGNNHLIMKYTNWNPKYSGLGGFRNGLKITAEWFQNPSNLSFYKSDKYMI